MPIRYTLKITQLFEPIVFTCMRRVFVYFLEEIEDSKRDFEIKVHVF